MMIHDSVTQITPVNLKKWSTCLFKKIKHYQNALNEIKGLLPSFLPQMTFSKGNQG